jgi:hypothetical protein
MTHHAQHTGKPVMSATTRAAVSITPAAASIKRSAASDRWALAGVLALWAAMVIVALACIAIAGRNLPFVEEWTMVPPLTGHEPDLLKWLWAQINEHRIPLQKAIYLILLKAIGGDFRIGMVANAVILSGLSLALIVAARDLRGQTRLADAFFPLVLFSSMTFFTFGFLIQFVIYAALIMIWLLIIVREPWPLSPSSAVISGLILVLLTMAGGGGVLFTPFVALWLVIGALLYHRDTRPRWIFPFQNACVIISIALVGLYFVGYVSPSLPPHAFGPTIVTGARFVGMSLGPVGAGTGRVFPASIIGVVFCGVGVLLWASSIIPLRHGCRMRAPEASRFFGFLIFAAAMAALVMAIAWGRAGWVPIQGLPDKYLVMSVPGVCAAYFAWLLYGPLAARNRVANAFAIAAFLALPFHIAKELAGLGSYLADTQAFEQDLADGLSWQELAERHQKILLPFPDARDELIEYARMLHEAKIGPLGRAGPR